MARDQRIGLCAKVVSSLGPTIVFCRTKRGADRAARQLEAAGVRAAAIHGDRSQGQRERALAAFQQGQVDALVATDVAARGIHVDGVAGVVHLDPPADEKDYIHRSGRTGRAGSGGVVVTFVASEQRKDVNRIQRTLGLPTSIVSPDATGLPVSDAPARPVRPTRTVTRVRELAPPTPRRSGRPKSRSGAPRRRSSAPAAGAPRAKGNRKARRAHLQPEAVAAGPRRGAPRPSRATLTAGCRRAAPVP